MYTLDGLTIAKIFLFGLGIGAIAPSIASILTFFWLFLSRRITLGSVAVFWEHQHHQLRKEMEDECAKLVNTPSADYAEPSTPSEMELQAKAKGDLIEPPR